MEVIWSANDHYTGGGRRMANGTIRGLCKTVVLGQIFKLLLGAGEIGVVGLDDLG